MQIFIALYSSRRPFSTFPFYLISTFIALVAQGYLHFSCLVGAILTAFPYITYARAHIMRAHTMTREQYRATRAQPSVCSHTRVCSHLLLPSLPSHTLSVQHLCARTHYARAHNAAKTVPSHARAAVRLFAHPVCAHISSFPPFPPTRSNIKICLEEQRDEPVIPRARSDRLARTH
jgi:hypothetical protein